MILFLSLGRVNVAWYWNVVSIFSHYEIKKVKVPFLNFSTYHEKFRIIFENVTKLEITSEINQPMILL